MLEVKGLHKSYGEKEALKGIDFTLETGKIMGFIGHNGAGKTTALKIIAGILEEDAGTVLINGLNIKEEPVKTKAMSFFVPDEPRLYEYLRGDQYLGFIANIYGLSTEKRTQNINYFAETLGIKEDLSQRISGYSHGMKQKLSVVSALMVEPKLLILDEPFVGLDPVATKRLTEYLRKRCDEGGAVLFSTHVLDQAQRICDSIAIIKEGRLVAKGPTKEVIKDSSLEDVFLHLQEMANETL